MDAVVLPALPQIVGGAGVRRDDWTEILDRVLALVGARIAARWPGAKLQAIAARIALATSDHQRKSS